MHRDLALTYQQIYQIGFLVRKLTDGEIDSQPGDKEYPSDHPLVTGSHPPKDTQEDLERLRAVGILELETIDGEEYYILTELGIRMAQEREMRNRQIELEKRRAARGRELHKGIGLVYFTLVVVTLGAILFRDLSRLNAPDWQISLFGVLLTVTVLWTGVTLIRSFYKSDTIGWGNI